MVPSKSATVRRATVPVVLLLAATIMGLEYLVDEPALGDDLVFLTYGGFGLLWGGAGAGELFGAWISAFLSGNHVIPLNGFLHAVEMVLVVMSVDLGVTPLAAWGFFRLLWIVMALVAAAALLRTMVQLTLDRSESWYQSLSASYLVVLLVFLSFSKYHGDQLYDPLVSYSISGWLTSCLGFVALGLAFGWIKTTSTPKSMQVGLITCLGIMGVLIYEMYVAFILATAVPIIFRLLRPGRHGRRWHWLVVAVICLGMPFLVLSVAQYLRLQWGPWYSGTRFGFVELVAPTTATGILSALPLTNANGSIGIDHVGMSATLVVVLILALVFLGRMWSRFDSKAHEYGGLRPRYQSLGIMALSLLLLVITANFVFALSEKYQMELMGELGSVYLGYVPTVLVLCVIVGFFLLLGAALNRRVVVSALLLVIVFVGAAQTSFNSIIERDVADRWEWSQAMLNGLLGTSREAERCRSADDLLRAQLSEVQKHAIVQGMTDAFEGRYETTWCWQTTGIPSAPESLVLAPE